MITIPSWLFVVMLYAAIWALVTWSLSALKIGWRLAVWLYRMPYRHRWKCYQRGLADLHGRQVMSPLSEEQYQAGMAWVAGVHRYTAEEWREMQGD